MPRAPKTAADTKDSTEPALIWLRKDRPVRSVRPSLSRDEITCAAVALADADGLEAVSMRRIAASLGAGATSLYWYVKNKNDLFELMVDQVIGEVADEFGDRVSDDWRQDLRTLARATRAVFQRHTWFGQLGIQPGIGPKTQRYAVVARACLEPLTIDAATQVNILATLNNYLFGFAFREAAWVRVRMASGFGKEKWDEQLRRFADHVANEDESLSETMRTRMELHGDTSFEFGLECVLDGIGTRSQERSWFV